MPHSCMEIIRMHCTTLHPSSIRQHLPPLSISPPTSGYTCVSLRQMHEHAYVPYSLLGFCICMYVDHFERKTFLSGFSYRKLTPQFGQLALSIWRHYGLGSMHIFSSARVSPTPSLTAATRQLSPLWMLAVLGVGFSMRLKILACFGGGWWGFLEGNGGLAVSTSLHAFFKGVPRISPRLKVHLKILTLLCLDIYTFQNPTTKNFISKEQKIGRGGLAGGCRDRRGQPALGSTSRPFHSPSD
jgi:hypothetical protein